MSDTKRIIEINGVKLEVDLREAKNVDIYKVGDPVKVLIKRYGDTYTSYPGVIISFDNFKNKPAINVAYVEGEFSSATVKRVSIHEGADHEICPASDIDLPLTYEQVLCHFDREIEKAEVNLTTRRNEKAYFEKFFACVMGEAANE